MGQKLLAHGPLLVCIYVFLGVNSATAAVGTTAGVFDVTPSGAASYNVPITVSPGTAGMKPELSLRYSSRSGNGLLGVGWSLSGLSRITRCPATYAQDDLIDAVDFDGNDRLCLDGERLVPVSGQYGKNGTEYRTEIDQFIKVQQHGGDLNSGSVWFKALTKSGLTKTYGYQNNSAFSVPGKSYAYIWSVARITDTAENYIEFTYESDSNSNEYYVDRIDYTGNETKGLAPYNSIQFQYETRPDVSSRYMQGGSERVKTKKRLVKIRSYVGSDWVREYNLSYETSESSGLSLLANIEECGKKLSANCLPAIELNWNAISNGYTEYTELEPPSSSHECSKIIDINGDGLTDILLGCSANLKTWVNAVSNDGSQSWENSSNYSLPEPLFSNTGNKQASLVDVNGDGLRDFVGGHSQANQNTYINTGDGWEKIEAYKLPVRIYDGIGRPEGILKDVNGDGIKDLVISYARYEQVDGSSVIVDTNETWIGSDSSCSGMSCSWQRAQQYDISGEPIFFSASTGKHQRRGRLKDINGDGLADYIVAYSDYDQGFSASQELISRTYLNTSNGWERDETWDLPAPLEVVHTNTYDSYKISQITDVNNDGLNDIVCSGYLHGYMSGMFFCGPGSSKDYRDEGMFNRATYINTGSGFILKKEYNLPLGIFNIVVGVPRNGFFQDLNTDDKPEYIFSHAEFGNKTYLNKYSNDCSSIACKWEHTPTLDLPFDYFGFDYEKGQPIRRRSLVRHFDLDGRADFLALGNTEYDPAVYVSNGQNANGHIPDLINNIESGNVSSALNIEYTVLSNLNYYTKGDSSYPNISLNGAYSVVKQTSRSGGETIQYRYEDLKANMLGRGLLGFRLFSSVNIDTGLSETTEFAQVFPYHGMVLNANVTATEYYQIPGYEPIPIGEKLLTKTLNSLTAKEMGSEQAVRYFPYVSSSDQQFFDLEDGTVPLTTTRTETVYDNFGNAVQITQMQFQGASPGVDTYTSITNNQYTNDTSQWLLGRLSQSTVTKTDPDGSSVTRETAFEYDAVTGLLTAEITEPNDPDLRHRTDYEYDAFGNQTEVTVSGADIESRTTTTTWDSRGQFKTSVTNALGHTESYTHSERHGGRTSLTGPNDLTTTWDYDAFGREVQRTAPDGTSVTTSYEQCGASCPVPEGVLAIRTTGSDGSESLVVFDRFERTVLEAERGYDGSWIDVVTQYDNRDRKIAETAPHYRGAEKHWTTYEYDDHDRMVRTESPTNQDSSGGLVTEIVYDGLVVHQIDANGKVSEKHENAAGRVVKVVDALNNTTEYEYDPYGNKTRVTDAAGNVTTITYDKLGRKVAMDDPDMGQWSYDYDVLGNLVEQTDAKDQTMQLVYDKLDRRVTRKENPEEVTVTLPCPPLDLLCWLLGGNGGTQTTTEWEETTWTYDTAWVGELAEEALPEGFERSYVYDGLGRVQDVITVIDGQTYTVSRTYDGQSRLKKLTYPSGFAVQHHYTATGYLDQITDDDTGQSYWQLDHRDAFGNVELASYGNGHSTVRNHDNARGHIDAILTGTTPGTEIQSLNYEWDKVGNLLSRIDQNQNGLTEEFEYDDLYRLTGSTLNGSTNLSVTYDEVGNITSKSGVGSYSYGAGNAGPHAVTQITGNRAATYSYDANGNMTQGDGRTLTWTSFNKPASIDKGSAHSSFRYDPDRARYKHVREREENGQVVNATIHYVGDLYEREHEGTGFEEKHYIRAGGEAVAMQIHRSNGTQATHYLHKDHLGSITAITDANGDIVERYAFDAFGKRRGLAWDPDSSDSLLYLTVQVLDRGYTGHEHLDHVGLIHMNGRVYDPVIGRFVSADSFVQMPESTQGLNRYTYVQNNPLSYVDPSGHFFSAIVGAIVAAVTATASAIAAAAAAIATFVAPYAVELGVIGLGIATDNPTLTSIGFALIPGGDFFQSAMLGFGAGYAAGGDFETAAISGLTAGVLSQIGTAESFFSQDNIGKAFKRGMVGGVSAEAQGGKFDDGFLSVGAGSILSPGIDKFTTPMGRIAASSAVGGTVSEIGGGKFANGAATFGFLSAAGEFADYATRKTDRLKRLACDYSSREVCVPDERGILKTAGVRGSEPLSKSIFSGFEMSREGYGNHWYDLGGSLPNKSIRWFVTDVSKIHDWMNSWNYSNTTGLYIGRGVTFDSAFSIYNFAGMVPAAAATVAANAGRSPMQRQMFYLNVTHDHR